MAALRVMTYMPDGEEITVWELSGTENFNDQDWIQGRVKVDIKILFMVIQEFNHKSTTVIIFASLKIFMSKSMAQKSNHDFKEKCFYVRVDTFKSRLIC